MPFYIRAGKNLPVTCMEVVARFRKPPTPFRDVNLPPDYLRFRVSPEMTIAMGMTVIAPGENLPTTSAEMIASRHPSPKEMEPYERLLGDAMAGDATEFARQDYVEEAWRIVDPDAEGRHAGVHVRSGNLGSTRGCKASPAGWRLAESHEAT